MIFTTGKTRDNRAGFTLVELILVMTIMIVVVGIVFPSLKGFFHGRNLSNETQQFLSLTRYGRSRAIAEGVPVELWINPARQSYGLQGVSGYTETDTRAESYNVDKTVRITFSPPTSLLTRSNVWTPKSASRGALTLIRFQPDGFISDTSPQNIFFTQGDTGNQMWLAENSTHIQYDLQSRPYSSARH